MSDGTTIAVTVAHGDLRRTRFPVAVGHYVGDMIVNAEKSLDAALGGALRQHFAVGRYPGEVGTAEIVLKPECHPPGAIVIGLGNVGELTTDRLREVVSAALKTYALRCLSTNSSPAKPIAANFSTVLIGTDGGAFGSVTDSVHTIVRAALDANRALREAKVFDQVQIREIEFVELYEDVAIRAAQTVAALPGPLGQELSTDEHVIGSPTMAIREGGRFLRPNSPYSVGWWQRIAVRKKPDAGTPQTDDGSTALVFSVLTDRARVEEDVSVGQRTLIRQLITRATSNPAVDTEVSAALYQLLIPEQVKDRIRTGGSLMFMVDRAGAGYPFELMAERHGGGFRPLVDNDRGILRQFETSVFRRNPEMATRDEIYILANPKTLLWAPLPAADEEADEVEKIARQSSLSVVRAPRDNPEGAIVKLVTGEYRILHLAAHGQFDPNPLKSGIVVGDRLFLTPAEVAKMDRVPEFVFLNACYLGTMDAARSGGPDPRLAASLAEGFIQAGVRAVIAAGWAVNDQAGRTFASEFYNAFLNGVPFGDAVIRARRKTREAHAGMNTWGAYQCYGNADYSFRQAKKAQTTATAGPVSIVARSEALQTLKTMVGDARRTSVAEIGVMRERFDMLVGILGDRWADGEILHACGEICGELGDFDRAVKYYEQAMMSERALAPITAAEQLANLLARAAGRPDPAPDAAEKRRGAFDRALKLLDWMDSQLGESIERWALRGSLFKRRAVWEPEQRRRHVQRAVRAYAKARQLSGRASYGGLNAFAMQFVLASPAKLRALRRDIDAYADELAKRRTADAQDFWALVEPGDVRVLRNTIHASFDDAMVAKAIDEFEQARRSGPSPREWASVCDQVTFLAAMTGDPDMPCFNAATAAALQRISAALDSSAAPATT